MSGTGYLIDTNIVIYYLEGVLPESVHTFMDKIIKDCSNISAITKIELLGWNGFIGTNEKIYTEFVNHSNVLGITDDVINKTIEVRKAVKLKITDAIIAATAVLQGWELVTRNVSDFNNVRSLNLVDPFDI